MFLEIMPKKKVQKYVSALRQRESEVDILPIILADPEVTEAINHESIGVVCFRLMAAATRVVREERRTGPDTYQDNHASYLGHVAALLLYKLLPYSSLVVYTKRQSEYAENSGHYIEITDARLREIFKYPTLAEYDHNKKRWPLGVQPPIKLWLGQKGISIRDKPRSLGYYHGEGNLEDHCREAEAYLKSRAA